MDDAYSDFLDAFIALATLILTPIGIFIYRKVSDREQEEIDERILTPKRRPTDRPPTA